MNAANATSLPAHAPLDVAAIRREFPVLATSVHGKPLCYLDNAASSQRPQRGDRRHVALLRDDSRQRASRRAHAEPAGDRPVRRRAREAPALRQRPLHARDRLRARHDRGNQPRRAELRRDRACGPATRSSFPGSSTTPTSCRGRWSASRPARVLRVIPMTGRGEVRLRRPSTHCSARARDCVALTHVSNALGTVVPVAALHRCGTRRGVPVLLDGAQAVPHLAVDVQALGCDFYAFSGHKMYGPTGIGVLYGREALLAAMPPWQGGGDMILAVSASRGRIYNDLPLQVRGRHAAHRRRDRPGRGDRLPARRSASIASPPTSTTCSSMRPRGLRQVAGPRHRRHRARARPPSCRSRSRAYIRTTWARCSTTRAWRSAPATTARCR